MNVPFRIHPHFRPRAGLLLRYGVTGGLGMLLQIGVLYGWVTLLGFKKTYLVGVVLGLGVSLAVSFILHKFWTFREATDSEYRNQFMRFTAIALFNLALTALLLALAKQVFEILGVDFFEGWYVAVQFAVLCVVSVVGFVANSFFTFRTGFTKEFMRKSISHSSTSVVINQDDSKDSIKEST